MTIKTYVGDGAFYDGIPARDLTDADFAALSEAQRDLVNASPLYVDAVRDRGAVGAADQPDHVPAEPVAPVESDQTPAADPAPAE